MSLIHPTAVIDSHAQIETDVQVGPYCVVGHDVSIASGTKLMSHVVLDGWTSIGKQCTIFPFASVGTQTQDLKYRGAKTHVKIGERTTIREYVTVNSGTTEEESTTVGNGCHIMAYSHIAHGCIVGNEVIMANCATLAGHIIVQDQAIIGGLSAVHQFTRIGRLCMIGGCTRVSQDCPPFTMVVGNPGLARGLNRVGMKRRNMSADAMRTMKEAYRILYRQALPTRRAVETIRTQLTMCPELEMLLTFIEGSKRGIVRARSEKKGLVASEADE